MEADIKRVENGYLIEYDGYQKFVYATLEEALSFICWAVDETRFENKVNEPNIDRTPKDYKVTVKINK